MTQRIRRYLLAVLGFAFLLCAARNWLKTARELRRFYTNIPIWDAWDCVAHYARYKQFDLRVFWIQHNEHRVIVTEVLFAIDMLLFHGRQLLPTLAAVALYVAVLMMFVAFTLWKAEDKRVIGCAALLVVAIAGYKTCVISLTIPFLCPWPAWEFLSVAALAAAVLHQKRGGRLTLWASIAFSIAATYTLANGMFVWLLVLAVGWALRFTLRELGAIAAVGTASIALYFYHYINMNSFGLAKFWSHPVYAAKFLGSFLGMPFSTPYGISDSLLSSMCGWAALLIMALDAVWIVHKRLFREPAVLVVGGYCLLAVISACLTAVGRMEPIDPYYLASRAGRYLTEPTLFWCALVMLTVWLIGSAWRGYAALGFLVAIAIFASITLRQTDDYYQWWEAYFQRGQWAAIGIANGVVDNDVSDILFPGRDFVKRFTPVLQQNHLAVFADAEPGWIGRPTSEFFSRGADGWIHGDVTTVKRRGSNYEVQGWADGAVTVVFADDSLRVVGFGVRPKAGPAELYTRDVPQEMAFTGFIRGEFHAHAFSVWALDKRNKTMWRMGQLRYELPQ